MSASTDALPVRNDFAVISLVGFVHAVSHFYHLVIPLLFPWLMPAFDMNFTEAGALMTVFFIISGDMGIMFVFRWCMTQSEPASTITRMITEKIEAASVQPPSAERFTCRKNTRCRHSNVDLPVRFCCAHIYRSVYYKFL